MMNEQCGKRKEEGNKVENKLEVKDRKAERTQNIFTLRTHVPILFLNACLASKFHTKSSYLFSYQDLLLEQISFYYSLQ